jgi:hypothetical protein
LPRWLAEHGVAAPASQDAPADALTIRRPLSAMRSAEAQYLFDLAHRFPAR